MTPVVRVGSLYSKLPLIQPQGIPRLNPCARHIRRDTSPFVNTVQELLWTALRTLYTQSSTYSSLRPTSEPMKKVILIVLAVLVIGGGIVYLTLHQDSGLAAVQDGKVEKKDLASIVSASGQIKPKTYVNIGANAMGQITNLYVKERDHETARQQLDTH